MDISRADFVNWVAEFYVDMDNLDEWVGVSSVVKELRLVAVDFSMDKVTEITDKVHASCVEFDKKDFNCYLRDKELRAYLLKRSQRTQSVALRCFEGFSGKSRCD